MFRLVHREAGRAYRSASRRGHGDFAGGCAGVGEAGAPLRVDNRRDERLRTEGLRERDQVRAHLGRAERQQRLQPWDSVTKLGSALLEIDGRREIIEKTANLLMKLNDMPDDQLDQTPGTVPG